MARRLFCAVALMLGLAGPAAALAGDTWTLIVPEDRRGESSALADALKACLKQQDGVGDVLIVMRPPSEDAVTDFIANDNGAKRALLLQTAADLIAAGGDKEAGWRRATMIATMTADVEALAIDQRSPIRSLDAILQAFHDHPRMYAVIGGTPLGGIDHAVVAWIERAAQLEPDAIRYLSASGTADALTRLAAGEAAAVVGSLSELRQAQLRGQVRILATTAATRATPEEPPTFADQGLDIIFHNWRGVIAPPSIDAKSAGILRETMAAVMSTGDWKASLAEHGWVSYPKTGAEMQDLVESQERLMRSLQRTTPPS